MTFGELLVTKEKLELEDKSKFGCDKGFAMNVELEKLKEFDSYEIVNDEDQFMILCRVVYWYKGDELSVRLVDNTRTGVKVRLSDWNMKELKEMIYKRHEIADITDYVLADN